MKFLWLDGPQWILLLNAKFVAILLVDALQGHLRRGFYRWTQFLPFIFGLWFLAASWARIFGVDLAFELASESLCVVGLIGFTLHHVFGIVRKPGGYSWFRHYLMHGPTALAPLGLTLAGLTGLAVMHSSHEVTVHGTTVLAGQLIPIFAAVLAGAIAQAALLHFRGAYNNVAMYLPLTIPLVTLIALFVPIGATALATLFGLTALTGMIGEGMHLRGFDRMINGLNFFNFLSGPAVFAPMVFTVVGLEGLVMVYLL